MDVVRRAPTLDEVWDAMRCPDCQSAVSVIMSHRSRPQVQIFHGLWCPAIPDPTKRIYMCPLPETFDVTIAPPTEEET